MDIHSIAQKIYSDKSDMEWDFPQYKNMRDATNIARELMRTYYTPPSILPIDRSANVPMYANESGPIYSDDRIRAMIDGTSVSYSDEQKICTPDQTITEQKKKRLISFPKIR